MLCCFIDFSGILTKYWALFEATALRKSPKNQLTYKEHVFGTFSCPGGSLHVSKRSYTGVFHFLAVNIRNPVSLKLCTFCLRAIVSVNCSIKQTVFVVLSVLSAYSCLSPGRVLTG